jgi:CO/xanthine dehydrogenase Mo-binding subunit
MQAYDRVTRAFGWGSRSERGQADGSKWRGYGVAAHRWMGAGGTRTRLLQVAAAELGLPLDGVAIHLGDTATGPYSPVSSGSATRRR